MKIRSTETLLDLLDEEVAWRRRELTSLRGEINARSGLTQAMLLRAGTALLYAHFEGFVKAAAEMYVNFVAYRRLTHEELASPFLALCLRKVINEAHASGAAAPAVELVDFIRTHMSARASVPRVGAISTESNLSSKVLGRVLETVGLDQGRYALRGNLIDEELLKRRNEIAHGRALQVGLDDYDQVHNAVLELIDDIRTQIAIHALEERYRAA